MSLKRIQVRPLLSQTPELGSAVLAGGEPPGLNPCRHPCRQKPQPSPAGPALPPTYPDLRTRPAGWDPDGWPTVPATRRMRGRRRAHASLAGHPRTAPPTCRFAAIPTLRASSLHRSVESACWAKNNREAPPGPRGSYVQPFQPMGSAGGGATAAPLTGDNRARPQARAGRAVAGPIGSMGGEWRGGARGESGHPIRAWPPGATGPAACGLPSAARRGRARLGQSAGAHGAERAPQMLGFLSWLSPAESCFLQLPSRAAAGGAETPRGGGRGEEAGSQEPRLLSAGLRVLSRRFLGLEVGVGGGSGRHPSPPRQRLRVRPLASRALSPAPYPPHEGVRAGSGGRPRALHARRGRRRRRGAGLRAVGAEHPARPALRRALRLCLPAAVAAAPVPWAAAELPEPLPLPLSPVGSAQDHPLLRRLLAQRLPAPAPAARSPALLPPLAALLLPLLSPVLHALSPQPLPSGGKAGGPARGAGRESGAAEFNSGWGPVRGGCEPREADSRAARGKPRHAWCVRQGSRLKLKQPIGSATEGLAGCERECVFRQLETAGPAFVQLPGSLRARCRCHRQSGIAKSSSPGSSAEAGLCWERLDAEVAAALLKLDCCQPLRHQAELFLCYCCCVSFIRSFILSCISFPRAR